MSSKKKSKQTEKVISPPPVKVPVQDDDPSDSDSNDNSSDSSDSDLETPLSSNAAILARHELLKTQIELDLYGIYGETRFNRVVNSLEDRGAWSMTRGPGEDKDKSTETLLEQAIINPKCFHETKIPSLKSFLSFNGDKFEKPHFDQALQLKNLLLPISLALDSLHNGDVELATTIITSLEKKTIRDLQIANYNRLVSKFPDKNARTILKLPKHHAAHDEEVIDLVDKVRKLQKKLAPPTSKKPKKETRTPRTKIPIKRDPKTQSEDKNNSQETPKVPKDTSGEAASSTQHPKKVTKKKG
jgi:hypothetical protein